jgi:hypothetical protein
MFRGILVFNILFICLFSVVSWAKFPMFASFPRKEIKLIQHNGNIAGAATNPTISFSTTPGTGNFIVVTAANYGGGVTGVVDNQSGNTYNFVAGATEGGGGRASLYYAMNVNSSGTFTITIQGTGIYAYHIREYSGVATSSALDQSNSATGSSTAINSGNITTSTNGQLYIAVQTHGNTTTTTAGAGWGNHVVTTEDNGGYQALSTEDKIGVAAGTHAGTFTLAGSGTWAAIVASFRPAP